MDYESYLRAILALILVIGLIGLLSFLLKRFQLEGRLTKKMGEDRRLSVVEMTPLDARRRLVLVKRDNVEHLVILGQNSELVVESGIKATKKT